MGTNIPTNNDRKGRSKLRERDKSPQTKGLLGGGGGGGGGGAGCGGGGGGGGGALKYRRVFMMHELLTVFMVIFTPSTSSGTYVWLGFHPDQSPGFPHWHFVRIMCCPSNLLHGLGTAPF